MLDVMKKMRLSFATRKLAVEDAKKLFEDKGWVATK